MGGHKNLDGVNRNILRILSLYEDSDILQLWYELGENNLTREGLTKKAGVSHGPRVCETNHGSGWGHGLGFEKRRSW